MRAFCQWRFLDSGRYNLEACPEYYLRKMLFVACQEANIFAGVDRPLSLQDSEFITGVNELINLREEKYVIELVLGSDKKEGGALVDMGEVPIEGSKETILAYIKQGSPCLARVSSQVTSGSALDGTMIVGYEHGVLLAQTGSGERTPVDDADLEEFDEFVVPESRN